MIDMRRAVAALRPRHPAAVDFVLRHGELKPGHRLPHFIPPGLPKHCYWNALVLSLRDGLAYVEGFAQHPQVFDGTAVGRAMPHAWNEDAAGNVVDNTWGALLPNPQNGQYLGVRFSAARAHEATWHGDASVLLDPRPEAVTRQPWIGEPSPGLLAGLVDRIADDMHGYNDDSTRTARLLRATARREGWPAA